MPKISLLSYEEISQIYYFKLHHNTNFKPHQYQQDMRLPT